MSREWTLATKDRPCPICAKTDWCTVGGKFIHCMRVKSEKTCENGGWLHLIQDAKMQTPIPMKKPIQSNEEIDRWLRPIVEKARADRTRLQPLAKTIGVSAGALSSIETGIWRDDRNRFCWLFPEVSADGKYIGASRRYDDGRKLSIKGARRGLCFHRAGLFFSHPSPIFIVEGASDVCALLSMNFIAIGRPSNLGGIAELTKLLKNRKRQKLIVIGENDRKGELYLSQSEHDKKCRCCGQCWPGKYGAVQTAIKLSQKLGSTISIAFPPKEFKDVRSWFNAMAPDPEDAAQCAVAAKEWKKIAR